MHQAADTNKTKCNWFNSLQCLYISKKTFFAVSFKMCPYVTDSRTARIPGWHLSGNSQLGFLTAGACIPEKKILGIEK